MTTDTELPEDDAREALLRKIQTEGVELAYATAVAICRDPKAPAPAKATALTALFRVAGYFNKPDTGEEKEPHEMSPAELAAATKAAIRQLKARARDDADAGDDVFR